MIIMDVLNQRTILHFLSESQTEDPMRNNTHFNDWTTSQPYRLIIGVLSIYKYKNERTFSMFL